jgi:hypothetical protein
LFVKTVLDRPISAVLQLAFLCNSLECFVGTLDPVLAVIAVGGELSDHLINAAGSGTRDIAGSEIDALSNSILMTQRLSPSTERQPAPLAHQRSRLQRNNAYSTQLP